MADTILNLRHYEEKIYSEEWNKPIPNNLYVVALVEAPAFPGNGDEQHPEGHPLAVVCAAHYATTEGQRPNERLWGWIHLDPEAKKEIGQDLMTAGAEVGRWYYLILQPTRGCMSVGG